MRRDWIIFDHDAVGDRLAKAEAALAAEKEKVRELVEALEWYVMEDDVIEGMEGNEFWVEGKRKAQALIEKYKDEPNA